MKVPQLGTLSPRQTAISVIAGMAGALIVGGGIGYVSIHNTASTSTGGNTTSGNATNTANQGSLTSPEAASPLTIPSSSPAAQANESQSTLLAPSSTPTPTPNLSPTETPCIPPTQPSTQSVDYFHQAGATGGPGYEGQPKYAGSFTTPSGTCGQIWIYTDFSAASSTCGAYDGQWDLQGPANRIGGAINQPAAWHLVSAGNFSVTVSGVTNSCSWSVAVSG